MLPARITQWPAAPPRVHGMTAGGAFVLGTTFETKARPIGLGDAISELTSSWTTPWFSARYAKVRPETASVSVASERGWPPTPERTRGFTLFGTAERWPERPLRLPARSIASTAT